MHIASWNVQCGGFVAYNPLLPAPAHGEVVSRVIRRLHDAEKVSSLTLLDVYRWNEYYGGETGIARHLGYKQARYTDLDDDRLLRKHGPGIGVVFATDERIIRSEVLRLDTRNALSVTIQHDARPLRIISLYLDDMSEDVRTAQIEALRPVLATDIDTVLLGDCNTVRPHMAGAPWQYRLGDAVFRGAVFAWRFLPRSYELHQALPQMNRRTIVPLLESLGYTDADAIVKRPTMYRPAPLIALDYMFSKNVRLRNFKILPRAVAGNASDHAPIIAYL